jgi:glycosyltransferase involved in cell wall biosynthesis
LIEHGREGFITPIRSPALVAEYIETLWRDRDLREEMGRAGRRRVESLGGWSTYAQILVEAFRDALAGRPIAG